MSGTIGYPIHPPARLDSRIISLPQDARQVMT